MKVLFLSSIVACCLLVSCSRHEPVGELQSAPASVRVTSVGISIIDKIKILLASRSSAAVLKQKIFDTSEKEMVKGYVIAYVNKKDFGVGWHNLIEASIAKDRMDIIGVLINKDVVSSTQMKSDNKYLKRAQLWFDALQGEDMATEILKVAIDPATFKNGVLEKRLVEGFLQNENWSNELFLTLLEKRLIKDKVLALDIVGSENKGMANTIIDRMDNGEPEEWIFKQLLKDSPNIEMAQYLVERKGVGLDAMLAKLAEMSSIDLLAKEEALKDIWSSASKDTEEVAKLNKLLVDANNQIRKNDSEKIASFINQRILNTNQTTKGLEDAVDEYLHVHKYSADELLDAAIETGRTDVIEMLINKDKNLNMVSLWLRALEKSDNDGIQKAVAAITREQDAGIEEKVVKHFLSEGDDKVAVFRSLLDKGLIEDKVSALDIVGIKNEKISAMIMEKMNGMEATAGFNQALGKNQPRLTIAEELLTRKNVDVGDMLEKTMKGMLSDNPQKTDFKRFKFLLERTNIDISDLSRYSDDWESPMHKFVTIVSSYGKGLDVKTIRGTLETLQAKGATIGNIEDSKQFWKFLEDYVTPASEVETNKILIAAIKNSIKKKIRVEDVPPTIAGAKMRSDKINSNIINWINGKLGSKGDMQDLAKVGKDDWSKFTEDHHSKFIELAPNLKVTDEGPNARGVRKLLLRLDPNAQAKEQEVLKVRRNQITDYLKLRAVQILNMSADADEKTGLYHDLIAAAINLRRQADEGGRLWWGSELKLSKDEATRKVQRLERQEIARLLLGEKGLNVVTP